MRIRVIPQGIIADLDQAENGFVRARVDKLAHFLEPNDGIIIYCPNSDYSICRALSFCDVLDTSPSSETCTVDVRHFEADIVPDSRARHRWKKNPYLCLDKGKVDKYGLVNLFVAAFNDVSWRARKLDDAVNAVFRPDLSRPTLNPTEGFVYLLSSGSLYKIGKAIDIESRQKQVERDVSQKLVEVHRIRSNDYTRAEAELHLKFQHRRIRGEWFNLSTVEINQICAMSELNYDL